MVRKRIYHCNYNSHSYSNTNCNTNTYACPFFHRVIVKATEVVKRTRFSGDVLALAFTNGKVTY